MYKLIAHALTKREKAKKAERVITADPDRPVKRSVVKKKVWKVYHG